VFQRCLAARISFNEVERYQPFQCLVKGTALATRSCQFDTMFTEPAVPHSLHEAASDHRPR